MRLALSNPMNIDEIRLKLPSIWLIRKPIASDRLSRGAFGDAWRRDFIRSASGTLKPAENSKDYASWISVNASSLSVLLAIAHSVLRVQSVASERSASLSDTKKKN
jgi:hypothetical protein